MPGIKRLNDKEFIRAFQVMDDIIQNNQPLFMLVWVGSILASLVTLIYVFMELNSGKQLLLISTIIIYLLGVQLPTIVFNLPLNNKLQKLDIDQLKDASIAQARNDFESRWNQWNIFRTITSCIVTLLLLIALTGL